MDFNEDDNVESLPHDLVSDILSRLPAKSLCRFSCVSTLWYDTIYYDPSFFRSHFSRSQSKRPNHQTLLFTFPNPKNLELLIFSATIPAQTQSPSPPSAAAHHLTLPGFVGRFESKSVQGIIGFEIDWGIRICNPTTRQLITLPQLEESTEKTPHSPEFSYYGATIFGFDPVHNEHKVLSTKMTSTGDPQKLMIMEHSVFTVESDRVWRRIYNGPPHFPAGRDNVCINGVVYYRSYIGMNHPVHHIIVGFDVCREEFHIIELPVDLTFHSDSALLQCEGHLAIVEYQGLTEGTSLDIWVLEDEGNSRWANKRNVVFPDNWSDVKGDGKIHLAGTTSTGEMIIGPRNLKMPVYVFLYDMKSNGLRRVEICGLPDFEIKFGNEYWNVISVSDHVESILTLAEPDFEEDY